MAANGLDLGEGSPVDVLASTKYLGEQDALTIRDNAARRAWAGRIDKQNLLDEAASAKATASSISPFMASVGSLLGDAGSVSSAYESYSANRPQAKPGTFRAEP